MKRSYTRKTYVASEKLRESRMCLILRLSNLGRRRRDLLEDPDHYANDLDRLGPGSIGIDWALVARVIRAGEEGNLAPLVAP